MRLHGEWGALVLALVCAGASCKSSSGGDKAEAENEHGITAKWILPAVCDGPYLQISVDVPESTPVVLFGEQAYRNNKGRAYRNGTLAQVGDAAAVKIQVGGMEKSVPVPTKPTYPYELVGAMVRQKIAGHWTGKGTVGAQTWDLRADFGPDGALRFPLPCGATTAKPAGGGPTGTVEIVEDDPFYAATTGDSYLDRTSLDGEEDLAFDLAIDGFGGPATMKVTGKLSVAHAVGGLYAAPLAAGKPIAWAPERSKGAPVLVVLGGRALPDLLGGAKVRDAATIAVATTAAVEIDPCVYTGATASVGSVKRTRIDAQVALYEAKSGKKLAEKAVPGRPPRCPDSITKTTFSDGAGSSSESQDVQAITGEPNRDAVIKWVKQAAR